MQDLNDANRSNRMWIRQISLTGLLLHLGTRLSIIETDQKELMTFTYMHLKKLTLVIITESNIENLTDENGCKMFDCSHK